MQTNVMNIGDQERPWGLEFAIAAAHAVAKGLGERHFGYIGTNK